MQTSFRLFLIMIVLLAGAPASAPVWAAPDPAPAETVLEYTNTTPTSEIFPGCITSMISVPDSKSLASLTVGVLLEIPERQVISVSLYSPGGNKVLLLEEGLYMGENLNVLFDDSSPAGPSSDNHALAEAYANTWLPDEPLNEFFGENIIGNWWLEICQVNKPLPQSVTLHSWKLSVTTDTVILTADTPVLSTCAGSIVTHTLVVHNYTSTPQTLDITYDSLWTTDGPSQTPEIDPGGSWQFDVDHTPPWGTPVGTEGLLTVSLAGFGSVELTTQVNRIHSETISSDPISTALASLVYVDGKIYRIAGIESSGIIPVNGPSKSVSIFDPAIGVWTQGADMPEPRYSVDCAAISGKIYCAGGTTNTADVPSNQLLIYDIAADTWGYGASMAKGIVGYSGVSLGGKYYVLGGQTEDLSSTSFWEYDPIADAWNYSLPPMNQPYLYPAAEVLDGKIYVAGGIGSGPPFTGEFYDPASGAWLPIADFSSDMIIIFPGGTVMAGRYLAIFGMTADTAGDFFLQTHLYDPETDSWSTASLTSEAVAYPAIAGDGDQAWLIGGIENMDTGGATTTGLNRNIYLCAETCTAPDEASFAFYPAVPNAERPASFTPRVSGGARPFTFEWDFGANAVKGAYTTHTFDQAGAFQVTMKVRNCVGVTAVTRTVYVLAPSKLDAQPGSLNVSLRPNQASTEEMELCNLGDDWLYWNAVPKADWMTADPKSGLLVDNGCVTVEVTLDASGLAPGVFTVNLEIQGNDPADGKIVVPVTMTVLSEMYFPLIVHKPNLQ
jgi:subtilisin-like proprotein convertase family protein/PKD repeat protein